METGKKVEATRQLGNEFLTWLLYKSLTQDGLFRTDMGDVELWFEDKLTLVSPYSGGETNVIRGEDPAASREAAIALLKGKQVEEARLSVTWQEKRWDFTFSGPKFLASGVKVPAVLGETELETVMERFDLLATLEEVVRTLYHGFLDLRMNEEGWQQECAAVESWLKASS